MVYAFLSAAPTLFEPIQKITTKVPNDLLGAVTSVITQKRGKVVSVDQKANLVYVTGEIPTVHAFDVSDAMRGKTAGRASCGVEFASWSRVRLPLSLILVEPRRMRKR